MYALIEEIDGKAPNVFLTNDLDTLHQEAEVAVTSRRGFIFQYKEDPNQFTPGVFDTKEGFISFYSQNNDHACIRLYLKQTELDSDVSHPAPFSNRLKGYCKAVGLWDVDSYRQQILKEEPYIIN